jgi:hypothetical protein
LALVALLDGWGVRLFARPLRYHGLIVLDLFLGWCVAAVVVGALVERRRFGAFLRAKWRHLVLAGVSTLLALAVVEIALRVVFPALALPLYAPRHTRELHHIYPANARLYGGLFDGSATLIETNEDGLRTPYSREAFLRLEERVVVLGDSFTFGFGVQAAEAFPAVLERELRRRRGREDVGVLSTGVVSYSPLLERNLFNRIAVHYRPTLTILVLDVTDIGDDHQYAREAVFDEQGSITFTVREREPHNRLRDRFAMGKILGHYVWRLAQPLSLIKEMFAAPPPDDAPSYYSFAVRIGDRIETNRYFILRHPLTETAPYFEASLSHIEQTAAAAAAVGSDFLLVLGPRYHHWNDAECPNNWESDSYTTGEPYEFEYFRFFEEAAGRLPFPVVNLLPAFQQATESPLSFSFDPHWNRRGHALVGRTLAEVIEQRAAAP